MKEVLFSSLSLSLSSSCVSCVDDDDEADDEKKSPQIACENMDTHSLNKITITIFLNQ